jgi:hypothetical protein
MRFAAAVLLLLLLAGSGCRKAGTYDIRGEWSFSSSSEELFVFLFVGLPEQGTLVEADHPADGAGEYAVDGDEVDFEFISTLTGGRSCHFSGSFSADDRMAGTMEIVAPYPPFAWTVEVEGQRLF